MVISKRMLETEYDKLINELTRYVCVENVIDMKEHFEEEIDSQREMDRIETFIDLIHVLEKRGCLSNKKVEPFTYILSKVERIDLLDIARETNADYNEQIHRNNLEQCTNSRCDDILPRISSDPVQEVFNIISSEIGLKWKYLARNLEIPEGFIDDFEQRCPRIQDATLKILEYNKQQVDSKMWKYQLMTALDASRRKDLSEKISGVFAKHGM